MLSLFVILIVYFFFINLYFIFSTLIINDFANSIMHYLTFNSYSPKAKLILLNNPRDEVEGIIQQH